MPASTLLRRPAVVLILGLCAIAAITTALGRLTQGPSVETAPITLPDTSGAVAFTAFAPDGNRLAYSQRGESKDDVFHVFVRRVPTGAAQQLTDGPGNDVSPAWSPDGASLAFLRMADGASQCIVIPAAGGAERKIADVPLASSTQTQPRLAWLHDGKSLAVVTSAENQPAAIALLDLTTGALHRITNPPDGADGDWSPTISPDGSTLAFSRSGAGEGSDIFLSDTAGANVRRVTFENHPIHGIAWMPSGAELVYATQLGGDVKLWRIATSGGSPRDLFLNARMAAYPSVSAAHNRLAFTETPTTASIMRASLDSPAAAGKTLLRSSGREFSPSYSPDGTRIADISDQSGAQEIWLSDSDGNNRVQITSFKGPEPGRPFWSPDGKWLLFDMRNNGGGGVDKILAQPGAKPERVLTGGQGASWSHDGKSIYFEQRGGIWKAAADGSNPESLTERPGSASPAASPDGKFVYYRNRRGVWRIPSAGGDEEAVLEPEFGFIGGRFQVASKGIYYLGLDRAERTAVISFFDFAAKRSSVVFRIRMTDFNVPISFSISPDGKSVLYPMVDRSQTTLKLVENFK